MRNPKFFCLYLLLAKLCIITEEEDNFETQPIDDRAEHTEEAEGADRNQTMGIAQRALAVDTYLTRNP